MRLFGWSDHTTSAALVDDGTNVGAGGAEEKTYGHADQTIGGTYERVMYYINCQNNGARDLRISYLQTEYYYT